MTIGNGVTSIGNGAFNGCKSIKSITLPFIGGSATSNTFLGYIFGTSYYSSNSSYVPTSLKSVTITSATSISDNAFYYCSSLTSVTIGDSVTSIGSDAFKECNNLTFTEYGNCQYLGNENNPYIALIQAKNKNYSSYSIHKKTKVIMNAAFYNCRSWTSVTIPDSVTSIGSFAFESCSNLTSVTIGNSVTSIGYGAFYYCSSLKNITIPDSVTSIGEKAFYYCYNLTSVTIPDSVTSIGYEAFYDCSNLTTVYYKGTKSDWEKISISNNNGKLTNATRYYYSESEPTTSGKYWHYDTDGKTPIMW